MAGPYPSSASAGFQSSGAPFPRPPLSPFTIPSQPPPLVGVVLSRPQHLLASRHRLPPVPVMPLVLPTRDSPRPAACRFLPLPAPPTCLRPPLPTSDPLRSPPVPHRPITGKRRPNHKQVNAHFVCVSDAHARKRGAALIRYPSSFDVLSVKPQRVNPALPLVRSVPTPLHPTASRQRPP